MSQFTVAAALFACLIVILGGQEAMAAIAKVKLTNPDHPGQCVIDGGLLLSPGQTGKAPNRECTKVECHSDLYVTFNTCPAVAPPKGCKQRDFVNTNRDYPACCERAYDCNKHI
ncbi:uncharacterized protein LOC108109983 [Drosophila eugracilis]|uniref:uncharacterized protein LOC108109983 n=1 Tax=Drosophila eugracilis TaxID=29029 RepID=UPI0007E6C6ED|nr:uncharacterized protein LOC108109983 [Drosophila eugracilis]